MSEPKQKAPAFQFYPGDWLKDLDLRGCPAFARGIWMDMLCAMWESSRRGYLVNRSGRALNLEQIASIAGVSVDECERALRVLGEQGVYSIDEETGAIFNRRMARDERKRVLCAAAGKSGGGRPRKGEGKGGDKGLDKGDGKGEAERNGQRKPPPSSSSSASSSELPLRSVGEGEAGDSREDAGRSDHAHGSTSGATVHPLPVPSPGGRVCRALRDIDVVHTNPQHPELLALLDAGVPEAEILAAAHDCIARGKRKFAYILATVRERRADAARAPPVGAEPPKSSSRTSDAINGLGALANGTSSTLLEDDADHGAALAGPGSRTRLPAPRDAGS